MQYAHNIRCSANTLIPIAHRTKDKCIGRLKLDWMQLSTLLRSWQIPLSIALVPSCEVPPQRSVQNAFDVQ